MTPRQRAVLVKMVEGIFGVAWIGLLALVARDYHTISLILIILICTMVGIGALTSIFDRRRALSGLTVYACVGVLSLLMQGYQTFVIVIVLATFGIAALTFLYYEAPYVWRWWFPDQPFGLTVKRWLRYLAQAVVVAVAYVHMRFYINYLTRVDPGNFPTALAALTVLNAIVWWLQFLGLIMLMTAGVYAGLALMANLRGKFGPAEIGGVSATRWGLRMAGAGSLLFVSIMAIGLPEFAVHRYMHDFHLLFQRLAENLRRCLLKSMYLCQRVKLLK